MQDDEFEWPDTKAECNWRVHAVSFEMARDALKDVFSIEWAETGQDESEDRYVTPGMVDHRVLFVSYTFRGERVRIISARLAKPHERRKYHNDNQA